MTTICINDLTVGYGGKPVISNVTLPLIQSGGIVGVLGANGAGKSTLLRAIAGLIPHAGIVHLGGNRLSELSRVRRAELIGYLPQSLPQASALVAFEAILSACRAIRVDMTKGQVEAAVEDAFDRLDIRHLAFTALNKLSGGQRQLVGLAQVIVRKPGVLLFDEPTSALDLRRQLSVIRVVRDIVADQGGLCLMALHDVNLALRHCDRLLVLGRGGVIAYGTKEDAMSAETLRQAYAVEGRIETCSRGFPFVITDDVLATAIE